ncbi:MAG: hypothetical protein JO271_09880, partial [Verrucomicrobia bacterium]|nr:hypothetical protein [Verrucomicrobiota bacterium]
MLDPTSQLFDRYLDQPDTIPRDVRDRLERACTGESVQLYGLTDLDSSLRLCQNWIALTVNYLAVVRAADRAADEQIRVIPRSRLTKIIEEPGLSCTVIHFLVCDEEHPFATLRYSHRQRQAISHVLFAIRQQSEGESLELQDDYRQSMVRPIKEAQASVNTNRLAIVWRLLGYLKPYRWQVTLGMTGAAI